MKNKISIIAAFLLVSLISCTERIDIELDDTYTRLSVDAQITTDTTRHHVKLTQTADYFSNQPAPPVSGAKVTINEFTLTESDSMPGLYLTEPDVYGEVGKEYTLTIENVDIDNNGTEEVYTASSKIHAIPPMDSIDIVFNDFSDDNQWWEVQLYAQDPPERNYYLFKIALNGELLSDSINEYEIQEDEMFNGNYVPGVSVQSIEKSTDTPNLKQGDVLTLVCNGITQEYYKFIIEFSNEIDGQNPLFSGPPANVRTNIKGGNGPVGFFRTYSITSLSMKIEDPYKIVKTY